MEFERALFRVYDRSMEGLVADQPYVEGAPLTKPSKFCVLLVQALLIWTVQLIVCICMLHGAFVGDPGCIGSALHDLAASSNATFPPVSPSSEPLQRRLVQQQQQQLRGPQGGDGGGKPPAPPVPELLGMEDVLQIKIVPSNPSAKTGGRGWSFDLNLFPGLDGVDAAAAAAAAAAAEKGNATTEFQPHYIFTKDAPLLYLDAGFLARHAVRRVNLTLDEACVAKGYGGLLRFVSGDTDRSGLDTVVINSLMYALHSDGFLRNVKTNETWSWRASQLPPPGGYDWATALGIRIGAVLQSLLAFLLTSAVTAIVVRMLMSSGVVVLFPVFICLRRLGVRVLQWRILSLSYPWLGVPIQRLRARRKPLGPFILAHLVRVFVYYIMYEASQTFFAMWLYDKSVPAGLQYACFGLMMVLEYFCLIFLRSALSIRFFPRAALLIWLAIHTYFYIVPYGFFAEALLVAFLLLIAAAIYTVVVLELPACRASVVNLDAPRAYFTRLETPALPSAIPPSWSLFLPLNALAPGSVYQEEVPERPSLLQQIIVEMEEGVAGATSRVLAVDLDGGGNGGGASQSSPAVATEERQRRTRRRSRGSGDGDGVEGTVSRNGGGREGEGDGEEEEDGGGSDDAAEPLFHRRSLV